MTKCDTCYLRVEEKIGKAFGLYGRFVARHPWKILFAAVVINGALGIGLIRLRTENDVQTVYTPIGSQASIDSDKVRDTFPDQSGSNFYRYQMSDLGLQAEVIVTAKSGNVLDVTVLNEVEILYNNILATTATADDGSTINFSDICAKVSSVCAVDGDFFFSSEFKAEVTSSGSVQYPTFSHSTRGSIYYPDLVGGAQTNGAFLTSAQQILLRFNIRTDSDTYKTKGEDWIAEFKKRMDSYSNNQIDVSYAHSNSLSEELNANIAGDIVLFSVTFTLMITYACVATFSARCDCVGQRTNLGYAGVLAACLAILAAFGIVSACGASFVSIVGVVPFLIIGIGVDDMFILLSGMASAQEEKGVEKKMEHTLKTSGVAITITSITDLLAFMAGASSIFLAVRNFCIYTGVAVIFCYLNQITFFCACLAINEKRVSDNRHYMSCLKVKGNEELKAEGRSDAFICCCSGSEPRSRRDVESFLDRFPAWLFPKIVLYFPLKICVVVSFLAYLGISIWGTVELEQGLELKNLVSEDSYYYTYRDQLDSNFKNLIPVSFVIDSTTEYSSADTQAAITSLLQAAKDSTFIQDSFEISWLSSYKASPFYDASSESNFVSNLQNQFLTTAGYTHFANDVVINSAGTLITASRFYVMTEDLKSSNDEADMMLKMRDVASDSSLSVFAFTPGFIFFEQYVAILPQTLQTVGIAVAAIFVVTCIFMPHPLLLVYVTVALVMVMVGVFGFLKFLNLTLSSITMIHIIMSVGFSVDFIAHICHGFMIEGGQDRNERVNKSIKRAGAPIFHGFVSSFLGILVLAFAKSYIFRSFFRVMVLVLLFGICHALLLLPVVLSWIGPKTTNDVEPADKLCLRSNKSLSKSRRSSESQSENISSSGSRAGSPRQTKDVAYIYNGTSIRPVLY